MGSACDACAVFKNAICIESVSESEMIKYVVSISHNEKLK